MIATIIIMMIAFTWLLRETDYLRISLLVGPEKITPIIDDSLCYCYRCKSTTHVLPERTIKAWNHTMHFMPGCNRCRAKMLRDVRKAQSSKAIARQSYHNLPIIDYDNWQIEITNGTNKLSLSGYECKRGTIKAFMKA